MQLKGIQELDLNPAGVWSKGGIVWGSTPERVTDVLSTEGLLTRAAVERGLLSQLV